MPGYKVTYIKEYEVNADNEGQSLEAADQRFTFDIREMLSRNGSGKISYLFNFKIEKMKKIRVLKRKIKESEE